MINTFLSEALIWQTEFQQWITQRIDDPVTSSAIGLLLQRIQFGSAFRVSERLGVEMASRKAHGEGVSYQGQKCERGSARGGGRAQAK